MGPLMQLHVVLMCAWSELLMFQLQLLENYEQDFHSDMKPSCSDAIRSTENNSGDLYSVFKILQAACIDLWRYKIEFSTAA